MIGWLAVFILPPPKKQCNKLINSKYTKTVTVDRCVMTEFLFWICTQLCQFVSGYSEMYYGIKFLVPSCDDTINTCHTHSVMHQFNTSHPN